MEQFAIDVRRWLEKIVKQRKLMVKLNCSHKPSPDIIRALERIENELSFYSYEKDLYMARFFQRLKNNIITILPGKGSTSMEKRREEFDNFNKRSIAIIAEKIKFRKLETPTLWK